ncbi:DUF2513 domain-containing protein [Streptococcus uberis]|uniref:DUF2513 domain-containing protein n=1 Tax=Streptococcus uberis TaxID=1349 RepID=UPI0012B63E49|nr:DUF2513 domain-containing protein [Streptococcus uberis]MTC88019.1 DUF2513 domain-containing protein [Streptococcus uberis]
MKLDPELIRNILLDFEELHHYPTPLAFTDNSQFNRSKEYDVNVFIYHCKLLLDAGFIDWKPNFVWGGKLYNSFLYGITYEGHQFLDSIRSPEVWRETKTTAQKVGVFSLNFLSQTASQIISNLATNPDLFLK